MSKPKYQRFKKKISRITIGYTRHHKPITVSDLKVEGALTLILKDAIKPNLVQTIEGTPALVHGGPFANIAHGCNSILATETARNLSDIVVTVWISDLGAEKFMNIKAREAGFDPSAVCCSNDSCFENARWCCKRPTST